MSTRSTLIVGAGIGGLAAGVALQRAGWRVRVFERAASPRELGFGLLLAPNAVSALRAIGVADRVLAVGVVPASGQIYGTKARFLRSFDTTALRRVLPDPMAVVLRPALHGVLTDAIGPDALATGREVTGFTVVDGRPAVAFETGDAIDGDVLIGADGVGSAIRRALHPGEPPPRSSGLWAIRGVAHDVERWLDGFSGATYFLRGIEAGLARASRDAVYWYMSVPPRRVRDEREPAVLAAALAVQFDDRFRRFVAATRVEDMRLDELFDRPPLAEWGRGPVTLLGDAAHPMLPHAGQGAAQALEDAATLADALAAADDIPSALRRYEATRSPRTRAITALARRNARFGSIDNALACRVRDLLLRFIPDALLVKQYVAVGQRPPLR
jgi:2-polyprenyl-6-methoxyphenol hydroxylase-like FAD-dependent oxidoreductase